MPQKRPLLRTPPEAQGIPSAAIMGFVEAVEHREIGLHSFMLLRHGCVVAEGWWSPFAPDRPHMLYSLSKSFTSSAIGMAIAEGLLSLDDPILGFFPDKAPADPGPHLSAMKIRHLLTMSTGHAKDPTDRDPSTDDGKWVHRFLNSEIVHAPGSQFLYNSGATYMLSAILQKVSGTMLLDYLRPRLFEPLGIASPTWETSPEGIQVGGWGLNITTEDIARFGQLYLQRGLWDGQRLLPEAWIAQATARQIANGNGPDSDWEQGYGFQFWRCRHNVYRGDGAFGQYCIVMPDQDAVLAITAGVDDMQSVLNLVWEHLLPYLNGAALPPDEAASKQLSERLARLVIQPPQSASRSSIAAQVAGQVYRLEGNPLGLETIRFVFGGDSAEVITASPAGERRLICGLGQWQEGALDLFGPSPYLAASGAWADENTLVLTLIFYETTMRHTLTCRFAGQNLQIEGVVRYTFGPGGYTLQGKAE